jgi:hypothetical protein
MATTTPNYGWAVPTSTDLVKDGATAIETLGDAIDASLVNLRGGTAGQVLTKTNSTQMNFAWAASGASAFTLINTTNFTTASTTSIDNLFSSTYDNYQIRINFTSSTSNNLTLRFRTSGTDGSTGEYGYALYQMTTNSTVAFTGVSVGATSLLLCPGESGPYSSLTLNLANPFSSTINTSYTWQAARGSNSSPYLYNYSGAGLDGQAAGKVASRTGLSLIASTGNLTGTISVYGLSK